MVADELSDLIFSDRSRDVAMATNLKAKSAKFAHFTYIHRTGVPKRIGISQQFRKIKWQ